MNDSRVAAASSRPTHRWIVLLVDDEPGVHEITKLVLANAAFEGRPIEFHCAHSAAEARTFLEQYPETALVVLDVVMETDDAGLGLVRHIRDRLNNADVQIVIRTGQPGMAPERDVILKYEINGYFLKTEITAQKLYSIVISGLRAFQTIKALRRPLHEPRPARVGEVGRGWSREALIRAVQRNDIHLLAQPEMRLSADELVGVEILPSWKTDEGVIGPSQLAEFLGESELRGQFDEWLIRQACAWTRSWQSSRSAPLRVSVPVVSEHLDCELLAIVDRCLSEFNPSPGTLDFEVPEAILLHKQPEAREAVEYLQSRKISVTVIDFGSGLISLPALSRLMPNRVKIHRSFVRNVSNDPGKSAIARSIIALAHTLGLDIVADGLDNEKDLQFLKWEGCDTGQGDFLARSIAIADVASLLSAKHIATH
jgi:EAL domain-containing protein (putative c-di-GMP-specific phosphodiesterase class I)